MKLHLKWRKLLLFIGIMLGVIYLYFYANDMPFVLIILWAAITYFWVGRFLEPRSTRKKSQPG